MQKTSDVRRRWEAAADAIERYPFLYEQGTWGEPERGWQGWPEVVLMGDGWEVTEATEECNTKACLAGWVCALNGYFPTVRFHRDETSGWLSNPRAGFTWEIVNREPLQMMHDPASRGASGVAAELLGLDDHEEECAFHSHTEWTPDQLRLVAKGRLTPQEVHYGQGWEDDE